MSDLSRPAWKRVAFVSPQCLAGFVETDDWMNLVVGFVVKVEDIFYEVGEIGVLFDGLSQ